MDIENSEANSNVSEIILDQNATFVTTLSYGVRLYLSTEVNNAYVVCDDVVYVAKDIALKEIAQLIDFFKK